jgi:hypothetical protein
VSKDVDVDRDRAHEATRPTSDLLQFLGATPSQRHGPGALRLPRPAPRPAHVLFPNHALRMTAFHVDKR